MNSPHFSGTCSSFCSCPLLIQLQESFIKKFRVFPNTNSKDLQNEHNKIIEENHKESIDDDGEQVNYDRVDDVNFREKLLQNWNSLNRTMITEDQVRFMFPIVHQSLFTSYNVNVMSRKLITNKK